MHFIIITKPLFSTFEKWCVIIQVIHKKNCGCFYYCHPLRHDVVIPLWLISDMNPCVIKRVQNTLEFDDRKFL